MAPVVCPEDDDDRPDPDRTRELLRLAKSGDQRAFDLLYRRYKLPLMRWAHGRLCHAARGQDDTVDLVHISFEKAFSSLDGFDYRFQGSFLGYLHRILRNEVASKNRRWIGRTPDAPLVTELPGAEPTPIELVIDSERRRIYEDALATLSDRDQELIHMREMGLRNAEIAVEVGLRTPNAARMAVARAVERLSDAIQARSRDRERS